MKAKFYGGPMDGHEMEVGDYPPMEWNVPIPPRITHVMEKGDLIPCQTVFLKVRVYRLQKDRFRGAAYCYAGESSCS